MAREFTSAADRFQADLGLGGDPNLTVGAGWVMAAWFWPNGDGIRTSAVVGSIVFHGSSTVTRANLRLEANNRIGVYQEYSGNDMHYISADNSFVSDQWNCVVAGHRASDASGKIFVGSLSTAMAEVSYASTTNGTSSVLDGMTEWSIGHRVGGGTVHSYDGRLSRVAVAADQVLDQGIAERYRLGLLDFAVMGKLGDNRSLLWMLGEPAASHPAIEIAADREDLAAFDSPGVVDDPPIALGWLGVGPVV